MPHFVYKNAAHVDEHMRPKKATPRASTDALARCWPLNTDRQPLIEAKERP